MNKKIKIIDLLVKIAKGEEVPKKIKIKEEIYSFKQFMDNFKYFDDYWYTILNDEVEILEDNTEEIEELKRTENVYDMTLECYHDIEKKISNDELADKINEIIRYIKRKDKSND